METAVGYQRPIFLVEDILHCEDLACVESIVEICSIVASSLLLHSYLTVIYDTDVIIRCIYSLASSTT